MDFGLLWFDDSRQDVEEKVRRAAAHYQRKFGHRPNACYVHPSTLGDNGHSAGIETDGIAIRAGRAVLPHHFWVGVAEEQLT